MVCTLFVLVVGVIEALSHPGRKAKRLLQMARGWSNEAPGQRPTARTYRTFRHLKPSQLDDLVAGYQAGATVRELATKFGVHRHTVGQHLRACGVDTKPPGLRPEDVLAAVALYKAGWSLQRIAEKFGTSANTVRARLLEQGVKMRARQGGRWRAL